LSVEVPSLYADEESFRNAVNQLRDWRQGGFLRLLVEAARFAPLVQLELIGTPAGSEEFSSGWQFRGVMWDVTDALAAAVNGASPEEFVRTRTNPRRFAEDDSEPDNEVESEEIARRKFELIASAFDIIDLRRRRWLKSTSKDWLATGVDWEVSIKHVDDDTPSPDNEPVPFATIRLTAEPPGHPAYGQSPPPRDLVMTLDREDVDYLLDSLGRLREALASLNVPEGSS
jgi:hypothetical protein